MEFSEALTQLKKGKRIRRTSWSAGEEFVFEVANHKWGDNVINPFMLIKTNEVPAYSVFQPNSCEVLANDWEVVK
ncbi:DUF2829 domain-containing protein [Lentilactobacillus senioris]|uniref:DUF2829 domain-containing protein n=1 Tax=Lentilactobacillus senioris TaxID=931534 RepID=UPI002282C9D8|nr:DUF2829 domain-containing protein [Lentilactobacillus senioris]MCY9806558.1 DUF2829 domain-containing protein [Lentilactobacillus senioris]